MVDGKWSDDLFLDGLRQNGDPHADEAVAQLIRDGGVKATGYLFHSMRANDDPIPDDAPAPLKAFLAATNELPPGVDLGRLQRGGQVFLRHAFSATLVFLGSSLPRGYAAPCLCEVLSISRDLQRHPFDRLMGVVQMLVNVSNGKAFEPQGRAILTAQKLRLLHAGVRTLVPHYRPAYGEKFGVPVNHEDMLATIMGFSYLLIDGLRRMKIGLTAEHEEDLYYLWRIFAQLMGIHPPGHPEDDSLIPATVADAAAFYASFVRRSNTELAENRYGQVLTQDNLDMMESLMPPLLKRFGLHFAPQLCMTELMTDEELARVGMKPIVGHRILKALATAALWTIQGGMDVLPFSARLARQLFKGMIDGDREGEVTFAVPFTLLSLRDAALE
jgi:hypothetical protein